MHDTLIPQLTGRSPHGERGLKFDGLGGAVRVGHVALLTESVD